MWWEIVTTLLPYTTNHMRFIQDRYYYETTGLENNPSRSIYCANAVNSMMGMAVSHLLVNEPIDRNKKMVNRIQLIFNMNANNKKTFRQLK